MEEVEVLEQTSLYIRHLEHQLVTRLREGGLPPRLVKHQEEEQGPPGSEESEAGLLELVKQVVGVEVVGRLEQQREEDRREEGRLVVQGRDLEQDRGAEEGRREEDRRESRREEDRRVQS